jgi:hypothetical protein
MSTKSMIVKLARIAALMALFGLALVLNDCSSADRGEIGERPQVNYSYGCCVW